MFAGRRPEWWAMIALASLTFVMLWNDTTGLAFAATFVLVVLFGSTCYLEGAASSKAVSPSGKGGRTTNATGLLSRVRRSTRAQPGRPHPSRTAKKGPGAP
ncbi:MAG TPA: hypothetical protein VN800_06860 [Candidatus Acidoferrales bacterium]|nr:hypothetical protein [Candidatus Acidoferrales bacterium]